jgi:hypothetical protein
MADKNLRAAVLGKQISWMWGKLHLLCPASLVLPEDPQHHMPCIKANLLFVFIASNTV